MYEIKMKTYYKDGREVETTATAEHFIALEEQFDISLNDAITGNQVRHFYYLAWLTSESGLEFKEWAKTMRDVDQVKAAEADPFVQAPSAGT